MTGRGRAAVAAIAALAVGGATATGVGGRLDRRLFRRLNGAVHGRPSDRPFIAVTEFGSIWASTGAAAVLSARRHRREALDALGAAGAAWLAGQALKKVFVRGRPYDALPDARVLIHHPRGTSWPSSHPAVLFAFVTVACRDLDASVAVRAGVTCLALAVGASRVALGVHYPADVAGGLLLGKAVADGWSAVVSPRVAPPGPRGPSRLSG
jgi:undecaprenyl-diphosphatase